MVAMLETMGKMISSLSACNTAQLALTNCQLLESLVNIVNLLHQSTPRGVTCSRFYHSPAPEP